MARWSEEQIERVKRETSIAALAQRRGIELRGHGENLIGLCPFHDDREPSLVITPAKNLWHCLGACGEGGSVIDWVMKRERVTFRGAMELLAGTNGNGEPATPQRACPVRVQMSDAELLAATTRFYNECLQTSAPGRFRRTSST